MSAAASEGHPVTGRTIVCLATQAWDAHFSVAQQVALRLAPENRVIYVEPFHPPFAWMKKKNSLLRKERVEKVPQVREVRPNLTVYRPGGWYLPGNMKLAAAQQWNSALYPVELARMKRKLNVPEDHLLWAFFAQTEAVTRMPCGAFIYDCVDDWPSFFSDPVERAWVERTDLALTRRADIVFVGSEPLRQKKNGQNPNIHVVNHSADVAHFETASFPETPVPEDIDRLPRPRIGFVGMIDSLRFDPSLISRLAQVNGGAYQIAIVGGFLNGADRLIPDLPNVHRLGMRSVSALPGYIKGMDVCIMPYRLNETTRYIFPLKLFEYLATGKPVVATPIPAVQEHSEYLNVAHTEEEFIALTEQALRSDTADEARRRQNHARSHDWTAHVKKKLEAIAALNQARPAVAGGES